MKRPHREVNLGPFGSILSFVSDMQFLVFSNLVASFVPCFLYFAISVSPGSPGPGWRAVAPGPERPLPTTIRPHHEHSDRLSNPAGVVKRKAAGGIIRGRIGEFTPPSGDVTAWGKRPSGMLRRAKRLQYVPENEQLQILRSAQADTFQQVWRTDNGALPLTRRLLIWDNM